MTSDKSATRSGLVGRDLTVLDLITSCRCVEWSLLAFASMRAVRLFLRARAEMRSDQFSRASSEHFRNYKWRAASTS